MAYVVGDMRGATSAIVVGHDVFGVHSGRTREICDELAESLGVIVICPDFFRGGAGGKDSANAIASAIGPKPWYHKPGAWLAGAWNLRSFLRGVGECTWMIVGKELHERVVPFLRSMGVERIALLGFCWGGWFVTRASSSDIFSCAAACHPSLEVNLSPILILTLTTSFIAPSVIPPPPSSLLHNLIQVCGLVGEDIKEVCDAVCCPQMLLPAGNDKPEVKAGGTAQEAYGSKAFGEDCVYETFETMQHGWVNRGDLRQEETRLEMRRAMEMLKAFYRRHLLELANGSARLSQTAQKPWHRPA